jgi:hypothetical protein
MSRTLYLLILERKGLAFLLNFLSPRNWIQETAIISTEDQASVKTALHNT